MAFTFTVEDGTIVADANSYVALADADDILAADAKKEAIWAALADDVAREKQLVMATAYLDDNFQWFGHKTGPCLDPPEDQALKWPRRGMRDAEGACIGDGVIPKELKKATVYLAIWLLDNDADESLETEQIKRFRSDEVEIEFQDGYSGRLAPAFLTKLLRCFGYGPNDRGFKNIVKR
jgi:hypothetical protein